MARDREAAGPAADRPEEAPPDPCRVEGSVMGAFLGSAGSGLGGFTGSVAVTGPSAPVAGSVDRIEPRRPAPERASTDRSREARASLHPRVGAWVRSRSLD